MFRSPESTKATTRLAAWVRSLLSIIVVVGCQASPAPIHEVRFERHTLQVGEGPAAVVALDLNEDGHLDLAVANESSGDLSILLGDGLGGFRELDRVPAGPNPTDLAASDLDGDGHVDLVVANHDTDYLTILLGTVSGGLEPAPHSPLRLNVSPHPHVVRIADLDLDGTADLAVDHRDGAGLLILKGTGGARFITPGTLVPGGGDPYRGLALGDFDGDGDLDAALPNPDDVGILLNLNPSQFDYTQPRGVPAAAPFAVALGDFNGDGPLDLIAASDEGSDMIEIYLGDGDGDFQEAAYSPIRMVPGAEWLENGDFNGDQFKDAAVSSYTSPEILLILGGAESVETIPLKTVEHPWGMAAADLNEDGYDDLVILDNAGTQAAVFLSTND